MSADSCRECARVSYEGPVFELDSPFLDRVRLGGPVAARVESDLAAELAEALRPSVASHDAEPVDLELLEVDEAMREAFLEVEGQLGAGCPAHASTLTVTEVQAKLVGGSRKAEYKRLGDKLKMVRLARAQVRLPTSKVLFMFGGADKDFNVPIAGIPSHVGEANVTIEALQALHTRFRGTPQGSAELAESIGQYVAARHELETPACPEYAYVWGFVDNPSTGRAGLEAQLGVDLKPLADAIAFSRKDAAERADVVLVAYVSFGNELDAIQRYQPHQLDTTRAAISGLPSYLSAQRLAVAKYVVATRHARAALAGRQRVDPDGWLGGLRIPLDRFGRLFRTVEVYVELVELGGQLAKWPDEPRRVLSTHIADSAPPGSAWTAGVISQNNFGSIADLRVDLSQLLAHQTAGKQHVIIVRFAFPADAIKPFIVDDNQNLLWPFPFAKSTLTSSIKQQIDDIARFVAGSWSSGTRMNRIWTDYRPIHTITFVGHADPRGSDQYNKGLGTDRANAAKAYFEDRFKHYRGSDFPRLQILARTAGENEPLATQYAERRAVEVNLDRALTGKEQLLEALDSARALVASRNLDPVTKPMVECLLTKLADLDVDDKFLPLHLATNEPHDPSGYPHLRDRVIIRVFLQGRSSGTDPIWRLNGTHVLDTIVKFVEEFHLVVGELSKIISLQGIVARNADNKRAWLNGLRGDPKSIISCF